MKLWRGFVQLLDELDLTEYFIGALFAAGVGGMMLLSIGYPTRDVALVVGGALVSSLAFCAIFEACFYQ